jgi:FMN phosphatase YigB (HAD superfamily)
MIDFEVKGAIFDVDDTLLDNKPGVPSQGLHERSRLVAVHTIGKKYGIGQLIRMSTEDNLAAVKTISTHTIEAAHAAGLYVRTITTRFSRNADSYEEFSELFGMTKK